MRPFIASALLLAAFTPIVRAGDAGALPVDQSAATVTLDTSTPGPAAANPADARIVRVSDWIRERVPACPPDLVLGAAQRLLDELKDRHPDQFDRLLTPDFPVSEVESALYRDVAAELKGPSWDMLREDLARRRVQSWMARQEPGGAGVATDPGALIARIQALSQVQYRRLVEGRMDDDDLGAVIDQARGAGATAAPTPMPRALTADAIVSEFVRHNEDGAALQQLQALTVEGNLKTANGGEEHLLLFKMRPDRFRLVVQVGGTTRLIIGGDGEHYWRQVPGQSPRILTSAEIGARRYLGEFVDPLFGGAGCTFRLLGDGTLGGHPVHRLAVRRPDGTSYEADLDPKTFQEIGQRAPDGAVSEYSDFRRVAGVTMAFREVATDREGRRGVFELTRVTPNAGLIRQFFDPPNPGDQTYFALEQLVAQSDATARESRP